jgi:surfeit locus 1 family protein
MTHPATSLQFDVEWRISLLTAMLLPFLVLLGFWQLQRADEKEALTSTWELRRQQAPAPLSDLIGRAPELLEYSPVELAGRFLPDKYFLLDNRIQQGRFGYEVLGLFELQASDRTVLVNRGWVPGDPARLSLPEVPQVRGDISLTGHIYVSPGKPYLLAEQVLEPGWPKRIQAVEMSKLLPQIEADSGHKGFSYPVRIDAGEAAALSVDWKIVNVSPEKHVAYAVQWFTMAAALGLFYILRSTNLWQLVSSRRGKKA